LAYVDNALPLPRPIFYVLFFFNFSIIIFFIDLSLKNILKLENFILYTNN
jgi:hypothetical protein